MIYELNNLRKDAEIFDGKFHKGSPVVEVFSAMVNGEDIGKIKTDTNKAVNYIKGLGERASNGDPVAVAELNTLRRFVIETPVMEEIRLLSIFGSYKALGFDESIEREVYNHVGERSRIQAANGDVVFPAISKERYPVGSVTVSGGYAVDYRRVANGDMSKENEGIQMVKTSILNQAKLYVVRKVYDAIKNATGVKYIEEMDGLTKTGVDTVLNKVRRNGKPTVIGDYALISQIAPFAGYIGSVNSTTIVGISEKAMNEIAQTGALAMYNGAILAEMANPYNEYEMNEAGDNFKTLLPAGLGFVLPAGGQSPIATWTRGGLTSCTGTDVHTGKLMTRFDLEVAADVAKGQEHKIGVIYDTQLGGLE